MSECTCHKDSNGTKECKVCILPKVALICEKHATYAGPTETNCTLCEIERLTEENMKLRSALIAECRCSELLDEESCCACTALKLMLIKGDRFYRETQSHK